MFKKYFTNYQSPSDMCKNLRDTEVERNENRVYLIKLVLDRMKKIIKNVSENRKLMIEENEAIIDTVERILCFNQLDQSGQGLKKLTANQMLSRSAISSAQLRAGNNFEKLKNKLGNYCILCTDKKNLQKMSIIVWSMLFKNGNNLYEH